MDRRLDETGFGKLKIYQNPKEFCYGIDGVLLADFASKGINNRREARVIDLCTGTGIVPLILSHKTKAAEITAVEVQRNSYETLEENIIINNLEERIVPLFEDVVNLLGKESSLREKEGSFHVCTCNPPYVKKNSGMPGRNQAKNIARQETSGELFHFVQAAGRLLSNKGDFYMVHRPSRLVDIFYHCRCARLEPKEIQLVQGKPFEEPNIVLIHCVKNGREELKILDNIVVHNEEGDYSQKIMEIYERKKSVDI